MKGLPTAIAVAGLAIGIGLYAGLHELAQDFHGIVHLRGKPSTGSLQVNLGGDVTLDSESGGFDINITR
jgi:hypothetical protein